MAGEWVDLAADLENWMSRLPDEIRQRVPIIHLAIPGSHVSASSSITPDSEVSPDCQSMVYSMGAFIRPLVHNWAITQQATIREQLGAGIRYLDLRVATFPKKQEIRVVHGLYGGKIDDILREADGYLEKHRQEILIVDFYRFYNFSSESHVQLKRIVETIFGKKLCPVPECLFDLSLDSMRKSGHQLIVIYRDDSSLPPVFWPTDKWPRFQPDSMEGVTMMRQLEQDIIYRSAGASGYISVCAITPESNFMCNNPLSNLRDTCATPCDDIIIPWLKIHQPGHAGFNVIITDFIKRIPFCRTVVQLNKKLMRYNWYTNKRFLVPILTKDPFVTEVRNNRDNFTVPDKTDKVMLFSWR